MGKIFLVDMDGVLADFVTGVLTVFNSAHLAESWPLGEYDMAKVLGVSRSQLWKRVEGTPDFWDTLQPIPEGMLMMAALAEHGRCIVSTSPSHNPACAAGKTQWLKKHFGSGFRDYMIGPHKWLMAAAGPLIDDDDERCAKFREHGGTAVVFPQRWNANHAQAHRQVDFVLTSLELTK